MSEPTFEETSRFVQLASQGRMHYNEAGDVNAPAVILIHGSGAGATGWANFRGNIGPLAEHFHVFAIDVIGWGLSDAKDPAEWDQQLQIIEFMDALGIEKAALVGNSMGGMIALRVVARHQDRVSHLITMGPGFGMDLPSIFTPNGPSEGIKILLRGYEDPTPETMKELTRIMAYDPKWATDELAELRAKSAAANPDHIRNALKAFREGHIARGAVTPAEVRTITVPSLLIHGRDDRVVPYENTLRLVSAIPNSTAALFASCGHWAQIEFAEKFNSLVTDFIHKSESWSDETSSGVIGG